MRSFVRCSAGLRSQGQPSLTCAVGHCSDASVVLIATAIEDDGIDALLLRATGDQTTDLTSLRGLVLLRVAQVGLHRRCRDQGGPGGVVHHLSHDVPGGPVAPAARTARRSGDVLAHALVAPAAGGPLVFTLDGQRPGYLPAFPTLRRTCSPAWRTPLPL